MRVRTRIALLVGSLLVLLSAAARADAVSLQPVGDFSSPIYVTAPPGDPRLFVVERAGYIQVVHDGVTSQFLDIHDRTTEDGERGLLSMAFDPNYASNGLFYVFYTGTAAADGDDGLGHVDEFHVSSNPNVASVGSRRPVLTITRPSAVAGNHNGGQLQFGKDGLLYISVGDGGTGGATAPDPTLLNGKMLRIDPHGSTPGAYSIPPSNPFATSGSARHEIWALGFRNPWRFSFDHANGDLIIADVGQVTWEEIDLAPASSGLGRGANFGWPGCEGFFDQGTSDPCSAGGATPPVFAYPHSDPSSGDEAFGCAIMGGYTYRGTQIPELAGRYLYVDFCQGELRSIQLGIPFAGGDRAETAPGALSGPQAFGEDASCNLYVTNGNAVDRIVGSSPSSAPAACPASAASPPTCCPAAPVAKKHKKCKKKHKHKKHRALSSKKHKKHKKCKKHKHHKKKHR
jgi:glucose/arabinose dehydrogenase